MSEHHERSIAEIEQQAGERRGCGVLERWMTARGDYNRQELHEVWCDRDAIARIPAAQSLDGEPVDVCELHDEPALEGASLDAKFCRYCHTWDDTTSGHGLGECISEHVPEHPGV